MTSPLPIRLTKRLQLSLLAATFDRSFSYVKTIAQHMFRNRPAPSGKHPAPLTHSEFTQLTNHLASVRRVKRQQPRNVVGDPLVRRLFEIADDRDMTNVVLGERSGLAASVLSNIRNGRVMPNLYHLHSLARGLDCQIEIKEHEE